MNTGKSANDHMISPFGAVAQVLNMDDADDGGMNESYDAQQHDIMNNLIKIRSAINSFTLSTKIALIAITERLDKLKLSQTHVNTALSANAVARENIVAVSNKGNLTRLVADKIPAMYIECLWIDCKCDGTMNQPFPVNRKYLHKLISQFGFSGSADYKSNMGSLFHLTY